MMPVCSPVKKGGRAVWAELPELLCGLVHHRVSHWPGAARAGCSMWSVTLALCHGRSASLSHGVPFHPRGAHLQTSFMSK